MIERRVDADGFVFYYLTEPGEHWEWRFGLFWAWRAISTAGVMGQGFALTRWGAGRKARRWATR